MFQYFLISGPRLSKIFKQAQPPPTVTMIRLYGFMGYLNHVDLFIPHVYVLKKQSYVDAPILSL